MERLVSLLVFLFFFECGKRLCSPRVGGAGRIVTLHIRRVPAALEKKLLIGKMCFKKE